MRIYVGNLQPEFTEEELRCLFETYGRVGSVAIIRDRNTRLSKGFAFVEMPSGPEAKQAIKALNQKVFHQPKRTLVVHEARPRTEHTTSGSRPRQTRAQGNRTTRTEYNWKPSWLNI